MANQKSIASIVIVLILAAAVVTVGVALYQYQASHVRPRISNTAEKLLNVLSSDRTDWTSPVSTQRSGMSWKGTIDSINAKEKIIEAKGRNQTIRSAVLPDTLIVDKTGNSLSFNDLKKNDFISISGTYQMAGKMTPNWEVIIVAEKIKVLGKCIGEGKEKTSGIDCCPGLTLIEKKYCTKCGDGICKIPENQENCPLDCSKVGKPVSVSILIDTKSFDLNNKTFEGETLPEEKNVKVLTTDSTKFYRTSGLNSPKEYFTFSEFYSLLKNWSGPIRSFTVKGVLKEGNVIEADEVFMISQ